MKAFFTSLLVLTLTQTAHARITDPTPGMKKPELCRLVEEDTEDVYTKVSSIDLSKVTTLTKVEFQMVQLYTAAWTTLNSVEDLKKQFAKGGELEYQEIYLVQFRSKTTGQTYYEVLSYPGDNIVAYYFDSTGSVIGMNEDDSISFYADDGQAHWCN